MADLYASNATAAAPHLTAASTLRNGILDLLWDPVKVSLIDMALERFTHQMIRLLSTITTL